MIHFPPLAPLSGLYRGLVHLRNLSYDKGILASAKLPAFVISIGNLSVGGTCKTPMTIFLAQSLRKAGWRVAIVARGYRREGRGTCLVSDGEKILADLREAGDEPLLLAQACPGVPVIVDRNKTHAAAIAVEQFNPQIILVDDGFQHRHLQRDLDLVLMPAAFLLQTPRLLPAGPLREPIVSLRRAQFLLLTGLTDLAPSRQHHVWERCQQFEARAFALHFQAQALISVHTRETFPLNQLRSAKVVLVSGIAQPERFHHMIQTLGAQVVHTLRFSDHYNYRANDAEHIAHTFAQTRGDLLITTSKDAVKLRNFECLAQLPCYALEIVAAPAENFFSALQTALPVRAERVLT